jgi:hypothetical protein
MTCTDSLSLFLLTLRFSINIQNFTQSSVLLTLDGSFAGKFFPLPVYVKTESMDLHVLTYLPPSSTSKNKRELEKRGGSAGGKKEGDGMEEVELMDVQVPGLDFRVDQDIPLGNLSSPFNVTFPQPSKMSRLLNWILDESAATNSSASASTASSSSDLKLKIWTGLTVQVFGITWYRDLYVDKEIIVKDVGGLGSKKKNGFGLDEVLGALPGFLKAKELSKWLKEFELLHCGKEKRH